MAVVSKRPRIKQRRPAAQEHNKRSQQQRPPVGGSMTMEAQEITDSLQRTKQMMRHELERVSHVNSAMQDDTHMLEQTRDQHVGMGDVVKGARGALRKLQRQDMQETVVLWSAVAFFYTCALYVLWTRIRIPFLLW
jgi:protein transport protein SEC20